MKITSTFKSYCSVILIIVALPLNLMGQQLWTNNVKDKRNANFYEVQQSFNNYWKIKAPDGKIPKGKGYKQFKRWEWFWEPRVGREGVFPSSAVVMEEWAKYQSSHAGAKKLSPTKNSLSPNDQLKINDGGAVITPGTPPQGSINTSGSWVPLGPSSSSGGYSGVGRLNCIAFHPTDINTFWVGSPSGGLWKTTTGGSSWTTLTDDLPVLGVSAIVIQPSNPNIMYIATGDRDGYDTYSRGIMKSTDGGTTWNVTGLSYSVSQENRVKGLIMHPANPLILLAAVSNGIYRTTDGGISWTLEQPGSYSEILFKPGDPTTVYASSIDNAQIFKSVNTGDSWSQVTSFSGITRIALAVTPANPSVVGAFCSRYPDNGFGGYYTSTNSGASFGLTYAATGMNMLGYDRNGNDVGGQGHYDLCLTISPTNANVVYAGGVNTWKSTNGGTSWSINTMWYNDKSGTPEVHADKHAMAFNPLNTSTLYQCNDGGLYKTSDGGFTWTDLSNGLQITQFYRLGNSATNANLTLAGAQDNGTKLKNFSSYQDVLGGDGMEAIIDYTNTNVMYGSIQFGELQKSVNGGVDFFDISTSLPHGPNATAWLTPYVIDPVNPQILYAGSGYNVYKTTNGGSSWAPISGSLSSLSTYFLQTLAVAPSNTQTIYAGSYYELYKTTNGGGTWSAVTKPSSRALTSIEVHPTNPNIVWITFSGYLAGSKVFRTDNGGTTWTNISGTLPNLPVNTLEYDKNTGVLYLGNDVGVFVRHPNMQDWQVYDTGLPNVIVNELEIQYSSNRLRAATYGRGLWESELFNGTVTANYCTPVYDVGCSDYATLINNFSFNTLTNNNSGCGNGTAKGYTNYAPTGTFTTSVNRGQSYSMSMQSGLSYWMYFGVWIDYNNDKDFDDTGEFVYTSPSRSSDPFTTTITIPTTATLGLTRMRVRNSNDPSISSAESCSAMIWGEAEDYTINISDSNTAPTVVISSPVNGATFTAPATVTITANAADANGTVSKVEFFNGATKLGEDATAPYNFTWSNVAAGTYSLTAKATDNANATATSAAISINVNASQATAGFPVLKNSVWRYHDKGVNLGTAWTTLAYDDAAWAAGAGVLGYGDPVATTLGYGSNSSSKYPSYYFRHSFDVTDASIYSTLVFNIRKDDGAVVYLNGVEQFRTNMPTGTVSYPTLAASALGGEAETTYYTFRVPASQLRSGRNVIAVSVHQDNGGSSDMSFDMEVKGEITTNPAPNVTISSPVNGATFTAPATITITADAADANGTVSKVEFFNGATKLGEDATAPYSFTWSNVAAGTYSLTVKATDNANATATSATISVTVNSTQTVSGFPVAKNSVWKYHDKGVNLGTAWAAPAYDDAAWSAGAGVLGYGDPVSTTLGFGANSNSKYPSYYFRHSFDLADASIYSTLVFNIRKDDGAVVYLNGVEQFRTNMPAGIVGYTTYASSALGGTDETTYFTFRVPASQLKNGKNVIAVSVHQDNGGSSDMSFDMEVKGEITTNPAPTVSITSPVNNASFTAPAIITLMANAADANGTINKVEFFNGATKLGEDATAPYSFTWSNVAAGTYSLTAKATDNANATATSNAIWVNVNSTTANCSASGSILREYWANISGTAVSAIPVNTAPTSTIQLSSFEAPSNVADNYGQRIRGYICAPVTGNYTFYIAGDDDSELWLSTNDNAANRRKIAFLTGYTSARQWTKFSSQKSAVITLQANTKYYIEAINKEGVGGDNLAVGWVTPGTSAIVVIPGDVLSPVINTTNQSPPVTIIAQVNPEITSGKGRTFQINPNPFLGKATIEFSFDQEEEYKIMIYNVAGSLVKVLKSGKAKANTLIQVEWADEKIMTGVYLVRLQTNTSEQTLRVVRE